MAEQEMMGGFFGSGCNEVARAESRTRMRMQAHRGGVRTAIADGAGSTAPQRVAGL